MGLSSFLLPPRHKFSPFTSNLCVVCLRIEEEDEENEGEGKGERVLVLSNRSDGSYS